MANTYSSYSLSNIDFKDKSFIEDYQDYCIHSMPEKSMEAKSLSVKLKFIKIYFKKLEKSDFCVCLKHNQEILGYAFIDKKKDPKCVRLKFVFPCKKKRGSSNKDLADIFRIGCLIFFNLYNIERMEAIITRGAKLKGYIAFIKRYINFADLDLSDPNLISLTVKKENVIKNEI